MRYDMEELVPIVGMLAEKYTSHESTSISYEKAEQLMGSVLYCIQEAEWSGQSALVSEKGLSARQMYDRGVLCVNEKVGSALTLYNEVLSEFHWYENRCLYDTFVKGMPAFFKWYDVRFNPQETILTLDYPVLKDIYEYSGIDKIYEYIECIGLEQRFLRGFPENYVKSILKKCSRQYKDMIENICEIVLTAVVGHIIAGKSLSESILDEEDYRQIQRIFRHTDSSEIQEQVEKAVKAFIQEYYEDSGTLSEYLLGSMDNIFARIKNAAKNHSLCRIM